MADARERTRSSDTATHAPRLEKEDITLEFPIKISGVDCNRVTMRRPKLRDRLAVTRNSPSLGADEQEVQFIATLCELSPDEIESLDMSDYSRLLDKLVSFQSSAPSKK
jgi:hypothetical protein